MPKAYALLALAAGLVACGDDDSPVGPSATSAPSTDTATGIAPASMNGGSTAPGSIAGVEGAQVLNAVPAADILGFNWFPPSNGTNGCLHVRTRQESSTRIRDTSIRVGWEYQIATLAAQGVGIR